jgi:N-methylhydantoinase A
MAEQRHRIAIDTGGTFTDLVLDGTSLYKSPTTPDDPVRGILAVLDVAAEDLGIGRRALLERTIQFVHGTTRATNAVINDQTARTAFMVTAGHPDILVWREGGRVGTFDFSVPFPEPYVPRRLTFEVEERIDAQGAVVLPLDEGGTVASIERMGAAGVEAVAVCLLWSIANPAHELRVAELIAEGLPGVPYTLSHEINPAIREYRRASAAAIDASLKPLMGDYLGSLDRRLAEEGLTCGVLVMTSSGGVLPAADVAQRPIHTLASGPAAAPIAGRHFAATAELNDTAIVTDAGGTSFDVSLVRRGTIPWTRETRIGREWWGHMTGFPSVDVKSIGAGGGSLAWIDEGGLLHVGPESAGSTPGPACYGLGGTRPTVTDACLVLGYLDPGFLLGGAMALDGELAERVVAEHVAEPLGLGVAEAAAAVLELATEHMVHAIEDIAVNQGVDPRQAIIVSGGGSGGFYAAAIAARLGARNVLIPQAAAALSAVGALIGDITTDFAATRRMSTEDFRADEANEVLSELEQRCRDFIAGAGAAAEESTVEFSVEARYPDQIWELELPLAKGRFDSPADVEAMREAFHAVHMDVLAIADPTSQVEAITWRARARCRLPSVDLDRPWNGGATVPRGPRREMFFSGAGAVTGTVRSLADMAPGDVLEGPGIVESPATSIVVTPGARARRTADGSVLIEP